MPADDADLPFMLNVESAFRITGRGTAILGTIEQGILHVGDQLEVIQPGSSGTAPPPRLRCRGYDAAPRAAGRDPALEPLLGVLVGPDIDPDVIKPGAKLRAARAT